MVFLKRFEAKGFKSYADDVKLEFEDSMIGIVGPNGAGKSNIIDAVKWVLGEKSHKVLRGKKSDDIIFHGSSTKKPSDFAQVTLTFDNSSRILYSDLDEISVTRKLYRGSGNNEYYINNEPARLKDIQDIFLDTGLSKGSLGIISQGTVNWFAEAKPEERKKIFEEAAGIGRYIKKKEESVRQLERAQVNFNRLNDLVYEIGKDLKKLETQVEKVQKYELIKKELTHLELTILVKDINDNTAKIYNLKETLKNTRSTNTNLDVQTKTLLEEKKMYNTNLDLAEKIIFENNTKLTDILSKINHLEIKKSSYENDISKNLDSSDQTLKQKSLEEIISSLESEILTKKQALEVNQIDFDETKKIDDQLEEKVNFLQEKYIKLLNDLSSLKSQLETYKQFAANNSLLPHAVKVILENKQAMHGVHCAVFEAFTVDLEYEKAILIALGSNVNNIIVNTDNDAKKGINFLKENKVGSATFMPIYSLKPKYISDEHMQILSGIDGFINTANNLVKYENKLFKNVFDMLLSRVIIADNIDNATSISKYTNQIYRIISLDGDIVFPGGLMKGGYNADKKVSAFNLDEKINHVENKIKNVNQEILQVKTEYEQERLNKNDCVVKLNEIAINISKYKDAIAQLQNKEVLYKTQYEQLTSHKFDSKVSKSDNSYELLMQQLKNLHLEREEILKEINANENKKNDIKSKIINIDNSIENDRNVIDKNNDLMINFEKELAAAEFILSSSKAKINETYKITIERAKELYSAPLEIDEQTARQKIAKLNRDLSYLGNINMQAVEELKEKKERFDELSKELEEATQAKEVILEGIHELDAKAMEDYQRVVIQINDELPNVFKYLFGGGDCQIKFTDEDNILESGIEVLATPPGKKVNSLFALSGGEKTLVALSVLFSILKTSHFPLVILDEAESALDPSNVERFGNIIYKFSNETQFIVITHRPGTMERCDILYGATMETKGVTSMYAVKLSDAKSKFSQESTSN